MYGGVTNKLNSKGTAFLHKEEGCRLSAYLDSVGKWTIGYGNTFYEDGSKVKKGDKITQERAESLFLIVVKQFEDAVNLTIKQELNANQFSALVSICYNIGIGAFKTSTLAKKVNANPNDPTIRNAFESWRYGTVNGKKEPILLGRRQREADLYFSIPLPENHKQATVALNLRLNPAMNMPVLEVLPKGTIVEVLWENYGWAEVVAGKTKGWVSSRYIE